MEAVACREPGVGAPHRAGSQPGLRWPKGVLEGTVGLGEERPQKNKRTEENVRVCQFGGKLKQNVYVSVKLLLLLIIIYIIHIFIGKCRDQSQLLIVRNAEE